MSHAIALVLAIQAPSPIEVEKGLEEVRAENGDASLVKELFWSKDALAFEAKGAMEAEASEAVPVLEELAGVPRIQWAAEEAIQKIRR